MSKKKKDEKIAVVIEGMDICSNFTHQVHKQF